MSNLKQVATRRAALIAQAANQRAELGAVCGQFQRPAAMYDKGYAMACGIKSHPGLALGAVALFVLALVKRGAIGQAAGFAVKIAQVALPVARFWLLRKQSR